MNILIICVMNMMKPKNKQAFYGTRKEAIVKQRGGSAWQIVSVDSTYHSSLSVSHCQLENLSLAICTPTPFTLTADSVQWIDSVN